MVAADAAARPRYEVVCRLAGGGMADLFLARLTGMAGFERLVVVKRLSEAMASEPTAVQALYDEARIAATLSHTNIVQVTDVEVVDGQVSIVMEFLHGHDVHELLRRLRKMGEALPLDQAIAITLAVCAGLHHAHERVNTDGRPLEIVHRDVSPHNVFVTYDGAIKIVDFGIARAVTRKIKTEVGVIKGKPGYIAPEQLRGKRIDRRTDVWATGVLLYEMTTGRAPYGDEPVLEQLSRVISEDAPPPSSHVRDYPADLERIVQRAMSRDVAGRYPSAEAMRHDLDQFAREHKVDLSPHRLSALMEHAFAPQLAAWRRAQQQGLSLAEHVVSRASRSMSVVEPIFDPDGTPDPDTYMDDGSETTVAPPRQSMFHSLGLAPLSATPPPMPVVEPPAEDLPSAAATIHHGAGAPPPMAPPMGPPPPQQPPEEAVVSATIDVPRRTPWRFVIAAVVAAPLVVFAGIAAWSAISSPHRTELPTPPTLAPAPAPPPPTTTASVPVAAPPPVDAAVEIEMEPTIAIENVAPKPAVDSKPNPTPNPTKTTKAKARTPKAPATEPTQDDLDQPYPF